MIARAAHAMMVVFLLGLLWHPALGTVYAVGVAAVAGLLIYEHSLVKSHDLSKVNVAFFNVNAVISIGLMGIVIIDALWV